MNGPGVFWIWKDEDYRTVSEQRRDDLNDVIREETSRGKKRPVNTDAIKEQSDRRDAVLRIFRRGTREDLRALLTTWGYSKEEIAAAVKEYDALRGLQSS